MHTILILSNNASTRELLQNTLTSVGFVVFATKSSEDSIRYMQEVMPDLILQDLSDSNAIKLHQRLRKLPNGKTMPIIAFGTEQNPDVKKNLASYTAFLVQPLEPEKIIVEIEKYLPFASPFVSREALYLKNKNSNLFLSTLMDRASCGIIICDRDGIILEVNNEVKKLFALPREQIIGQSYRNFVVSVDQNYSSILFQKLILEKSIGPIKGRIQQANGAIREIEYTVDCIAIDHTFYLFAIINDITERNRLHHQALLSDKLATVGKLATGIVHEINNPVTWLLNNLAMIKENVSALRNGFDMQSINDFRRRILQFDELITESIQGAKQIRDIVKNIKGYARIDEETSKNIDIHDVLNAAIKMAYPTFKQHAKIHTQFATNIPKSLLVKSKLQQVFLNLIVNAAQSMPQNNSEKNMIRIETRLEGDRIRIDVSDTGVGIAQENLHKIFEPFFTTKPQGIGTGLGLSICKEIIRNLGGEIQVQTELGKGTTFTVLLPFEVAETSVELHTPIKQVVSLHILVIDDEPSLLKTLQRILEPMHRVICALGGKEALDILSKNPYLFDLIITDLNMPDLNGIDIYRFIKRNQPGLEDHMLFMTGGMETAAHQEFFSTIDIPCIEKPFTKEDLLRIVNKMMTTPTLSKVLNQH